MNSIVKNALTVLLVLSAGSTVCSVQQDVLKTKKIKKAYIKTKKAKKSRRAPNKQTRHPQKPVSCYLDCASCGAKNLCPIRVTYFSCSSCYKGNAVEGSSVRACDAASYDWDDDLDYDNSLCG